MDIEKLEKEYLTLERAAEYLGKSKQRVWQLVTEGNRFQKIPTIKIFGKKLIKKSDLDTAII